jgi:hypothetical protein
MPSHIVVGSWWRGVVLSFFVLGVAHAAAAQGIAGSFEQLQLLVRPGDKVTDALNIARTLSAPTSALPSSFAATAHAARGATRVTSRRLIER